MKTQEEIKQYIDQLVVQGVGPYSAAPPFCRFCWRWGFNVTPPFNQTFLKNAFYWRFVFSIFIILFSILVLWWMDSKMIWSLFQEPLIWAGVFWGGAGFGLLSAGLIWYRARSLNVPKW